MGPSFFFLPGFSLVLLVASVAIRSSIPNLIWISLIAGFLSFVVLVFWVCLEKKQLLRLLQVSWVRRSTQKLFSFTLGLLIVIGAMVLSNRPRYNRSLDLSEHHVNSLSRDSQLLIERLIKEKRQVNIKAYFVSSKIQNTFSRLLQLYMELGAPLSVEYFDPQIDIVNAKANKIEDPHIALIEHGGKTERITVFNEESFSNAILRLLINETLDIYFVTGHGEPSISSENQNGLKSAVQALEKEGYTSTALDLSLAGQIPAQADLVILAGPKVNIPVLDQKKISSYLKKGGALLVFLDAIRPADSINRILEPYGLVYNSDFIVLSNDDPRIKTYGQNAAMIDTVSPESQMGFQLFSRGSYLFFSDTRSLNLSSQTVEAYFPLVSDSKALRISDVYIEDDLINLRPDRLSRGKFNLMGIVRSGSTGDVSEGNYIVAFGSSQFILNHKFHKPENRQVFLKTVNYILRKNYFIALDIQSQDDRGTLEIYSRAPVILLSIICFIYPFGYLLLGAFIWYRRKKA